MTVPAQLFSALDVVGHELPDYFPEARRVVHFEEVLARFPREDRIDMRDDDGIIRVDCAFCSREFLIED